jgi:predicted nucleic acid-binding protein
MSVELTFVDTNVLLYAHDRSAGRKQEVARALLTALWGTRAGVLSTQVLQEFYVNATRKLPKPLRPAQARSVVGRYATWPVHRIDPPDLQAASELEQRHRLSFWDALVVVSAARMQASTLLTEDLQHGRRLLGLEIVDPFRTS